GLFVEDSKWNIGEPGLIVQMLPKDLEIAGSGPDQWRNFLADSGLKEDRYIKAVEVKPVKGARVIHHIGTSLVYPDGGGQAVIQAKNGNVFDDGSGRLMKAGSKVNCSRVELLSCANNFNFNWMMAYEYASDVQPLLPAGSVLHFTSWHNNTSSNKLNLDPDKWIGYGQRSIDDMSVAWVTYYNMSEEEFKQ